ncbi:unnamed protein product [Moneuplotes crassus]|uniref:Uncharacterized protein n=1 Tax=Euplotes crassus TaxID=5936 RepID=A0AAD2D7X6_EUPCR|nr:unnamed protein product [Moneuplotes crassus]
MRPVKKPALIYTDGYNVKTLSNTPQSTLLKKKPQIFINKKTKHQEIQEEKSLTEEDLKRLAFIERKKNERVKNKTILQLGYKASASEVESIPSLEILPKEESKLNDKITKVVLPKKNNPFNYKEKNKLKKQKNLLNERISSNPSISDSIKRIQPRVNQGPPAKEIPKPPKSKIKEPVKERKPLYDIDELMKQKNNYKTFDRLAIQNIQERQDKEKSESMIDRRLDDFKAHLKARKEKLAENRRMQEEQMRKTIELSSISNINKTKEEPAVIKIQDEEQSISRVEYRYNSGNDSETKIVRAKRKYKKRRKRPKNMHAIRRKLNKFKSFNELDEDHKFSSEIMADSEPQIMIQDDSSNIALQEVEESSLEIEERSISPEREVEFKSVINSLSKLPPRSSAPVKKRVKDLNLLIYKPHEIPRIRVDRNSYALDKEYNNRVKREQFNELVEKDLGTRYNSLGSSIELNLSKSRGMFSQPYYEPGIQTVMSQEDLIDLKFQELLRKKPQHIFY